MLLNFIDEHFIGANLNQLSVLVPSIHLCCHVVQQHPSDHYYRTEAREKSDLVTKQEDGGPYEEGSLGSVGHTVGDGTDVVHQVVRCYSLTVEEDSIKWVTEEELCWGGEDCL